MSLYLDDAFDLSSLDQAQTDTLDTSYLQNLNPTQLEAVHHTGSPLQIVAGAGTGKTRVLTARIAYTVNTGQALAGQILALTFTNKAAAELRSRLSLFMGFAGSQVSTGTFHALCAQILRNHPIAAGLKPGFTIADSMDQKQTLRAVFKQQHNRFPTSQEAKALTSLIELHKNTLTDLPMLMANPADLQIADAYQRALENMNAIDFSDLILRAVTLLRENPDICDHYRSIWTHIFVDEYQDTNFAQSELLKLLVGTSPNITVVGDPDQCIYGFRHAELKNILNFPLHFPNTHVIKFETNYRSSPEILSAANALIANNTKRVPKDLQAVNDSGPTVTYTTFGDEKSEASWLSAKVQGLLRRNVSTSDIAILARSTHSLHSLETALSAAQVPYTLLGGKKFTEHTEIKDLASYLRLCLNPYDLNAFTRALSTPKRGFGASSIEKITMEFDLTSLTPENILKDMVDQGQFSKKARDNAARFLTTLKQARANCSKPTAAACLNTILENTRYCEQLHDHLEKAKADNDPETEQTISRAIARIDDLLHLAKQIPTLELADYLGLSSNSDKSQNGILLSTIHAAKGAEWPHVFLPAWEMNQFPTHHALDDGSAAAIEEERRLAFVAITRAQTTLSITNSLKRYGQPMNPSLFIQETTSKSPTTDSCSRSPHRA